MALKNDEKHHDGDDTACYDDPSFMSALDKESDAGIDTESYSELQGLEKDGWFVCLDDRFCSFFFGGGGGG